MVYVVYILYKYTIIQCIEQVFTALSLQMHVTCPLPGWVSVIFLLNQKVIAFGRGSDPFDWLFYVTALSTLRLWK